MRIPLQHNEAERAVARQAYETLEPYHVVAYFNPHLRDASKDAGMGWAAAYVGARGAPLGPVPADVVTACFYNFSPAVVAPGWDAALAHGLAEVMAVREKTVDTTLRDALGSAIEDPELPRLVTDLRQVAEAQSYVARPLAAAWSALPWPDAPHLGLWHATAVLREWRGDGHLTTLLQAGLDPTEAGVFHEATHPDPSIRKRGMGRTRTMQTRGWSEDDWRAAAERLAGRGLLTLGADHEALTESGGELYDAIERATDDLAVWRGVEDPESLLRRARPYVKALIDAGVLPGTTRR